VGNIGTQEINGTVAAVGRKDGTVQVVNVALGQEVCVYQHDGSTGKDGPICGVHMDKSAGGSIISISSDGVASIYSLEAGRGEACNDRVPVQLSSWSISGGDVYATAFDRDADVLAVGCKGSELKLYDTKGRSKRGGASDISGMSPKLEPLFIAKGGARNKVGLSDLPWNSAVTFYPNTEGMKIWVGTGYHKVRLYDRAAGKKPQLEIAFPMGESRITALAPEGDGNRCWVADAQGRIEAYDVRAGRFVGSLKGVTGSVRSLALHPTHPLIASVGLDRFLRLHNTGRGGKSLEKFYLKTELNCAAWLPFWDLHDSAEISLSPGKSLEKKNTLQGQDKTEQLVGRKKAKKDVDSLTI
jgi:WD40 repeat protein